MWCDGSVVVVVGGDGGCGVVVVVGGGGGSGGGGCDGVFFTSFFSPFFCNLLSCLLMSWFTVQCSLATQDKASMYSKFLATRSSSNPGNSEGSQKL